MPVHVDEVSADVNVEQRGGGGSGAPPPASALPEPPEALRWRLVARGAARDAARLRATDQDD